MWQSWVFIVYSNYGTDKTKNSNVQERPGCGREAGLRFASGSCLFQRLSLYFVKYKIYAVGKNANSWGEFTALVEFISIVGAWGGTSIVNIASTISIMKPSVAYSFAKLKLFWLKCPLQGVSPRLTFFGKFQLKWFSDFWEWGRSKIWFLSLQNKILTAVLSRTSRTSALGSEEPIWGRGRMAVGCSLPRRELLQDVPRGLANDLLEPGS